MLNDNIHKSANDEWIKACRKAADEWAEKTKIGELINKVGATSEDRKVLMMFAKQCFSEGVMQGSLKAMQSVMNASQKPKL